MIETLGIIASVAMPLFNIPIILKIRRRRSAADISLIWTVGVWICALLMLPSAIMSESTAFKCLSIINFILFSLVVYYVFRYRHPSSLNNLH